MQDFNQEYHCGWLCIEAFAGWPLIPIGALESRVPFISSLAPWMARCIAKRQGQWIGEFQKLYSGVGSVEKNWGQAWFYVILTPGIRWLAMEAKKYIEFYELNSTEWPSIRLCQGFKGFEAGQKAAPPPFNESWQWSNITKSTKPHLGLFGNSIKYCRNHYLIDRYI